MVSCAVFHADFYNRGGFCLPVFVLEGEASGKG